MYTVLIERQAEKDMQKLQKGVFRALVERIGQLANDPRPIGSAKLQGSKNSWRIRSGSYRVLYDIDDQNEQIRIYRIKHRKDVYR